jgi:hypothetical protein
MSRAGNDRTLSVVLLFGIGFALALAAAAALRMSLADDEAWILLGIRELAEQGVYRHTHGLGALTTGGAHTLAELLLFLAGGHSLATLRLFPLLCFALLLLLVVRWAREVGLSWPAALLVATPLVATPGTLILAGSAFAVLPSMLLLVLGLRVWGVDAIPGWRRCLGAGALLGLAGATRPQAVLLLPALVLVKLLDGWPSRRAALRLAAPVGAAALVMGVCAASLLALTGDASGGLDLAALSSGAGTDTSLAFVGKKWVAAERFFGLPLLVAAIALALWLGQQPPRDARLRVLAVFGALVWLLWIVYAPRAHLRYLWLGLASFALVLGFGLGSWYERGSASGRRAAAALGVACLLGGAITTARHLAVGDLNVVFWEWQERVPLEPVAGSPDREPGRHQQDMAQRVASLPPGDVVAADHPVELEFLSRRSLLSLDAVTRQQAGLPRVLPSWIVVTPHLGRRLHLRPGGWSWIEHNCQLEARFGDYALYRVVGEYPRSLDNLRPRPGVWQPDRSLRGPKLAGPRRQPPQ